MANRPYVDSRYPPSGLTAKALAAAYEVHRVLGLGFGEVMYQHALAREFPAHGAVDQLQREAPGGRTARQLGTFSGFSFSVFQ